MLPTNLELHDTEQALYEKLDSLASNWSQSSLEFGWTCAELWHVVQEDFMGQADGKEKKALTLFINHIQEREADKIDARSTVADRFRIARFIPRETYDAIVTGSSGTQPTYHQMRACIFTSFGELDKEKTDAMIDWAVNNNWPAVADIRIYRGVVDPKVKVDPATRHWQMFVKLSQSVMADSGEGHPRYNVAKAVLDQWKVESELK